MPESEAPELIHRDANLLIVHKPPGLPTTAPNSEDPSLVRWVDERFPGLQAHATSRLDSPVSGLVTFALNRDANRRLLAARRAGAYQRLYFGITAREPEAERGDWSWPISIDPRNKKLRVAAAGPGERAARTQFEIGGRTPLASLLRLTPHTGRTHQLRVHAARAQVPLFGDHAYGGERRLTLGDGRVITARRVMLHCTEVSFPWNPGGERLRFYAPARDDMRAVWIALGGNLAELEP